MAPTEVIILLLHMLEDSRCVPVTISGRFDGAVREKVIDQLPACQQEHSAPQHLDDSCRGAGWRFQRAGFRVQGSGFRVHGAGFRVQGSEFRVQGSGFRVQGARVSPPEHLRNQVQGAAQGSGPIVRQYVRQALLSRISGKGCRGQGWGRIHSPELLHEKQITPARSGREGGARWRLEGLGVRAIHSYELLQGAVWPLDRPPLAILRVESML